MAGTGALGSGRIRLQRIDGEAYFQNRRMVIWVRRYRGTHTFHRIIVKIRTYENSHSQLCTGKPPYDGVNDYQVIVQVLKGIKPPRPALPDGREMPDRLWSVTLACLQYLAADRPSSTSVADMLSTGYDPGVTSWENLKQS